MSDNEVGSESDNENESNAFPPAPDAEVPEPYLRQYGNTGVKGVLSDYASAKDKNIKEQSKKEKEFKEKLSNYWNRNLDTNTSKEKRDEYDEENEKRRSGEKSESVDENNDSDDETVFKKYREQRKMEILQEQLKGKMPTFGYVRQIGAEDFLQAIDNENPNVFIIVHLYKNYISECVLMNKCLQQLAVAFTRVKILKIISTEAILNYDDVALPTLCIYKKGKQIATIVGIARELSENFDENDVAELLQKHKVELN